MTKESEIDANIKPIASKEKSLGKVFKGMAIAMLFIIMYLVWLGLFGSASGGIWIGAFLFFAFAGLCWGIGDYQQKKFDELGETPLVITSQGCKIGEALTGKIQINKARFSKISHVSLTNFYYDGRYRDTGQFEKLQTTQDTCDRVYENNVTWLVFSIKVPINGKTTKDLRNRRFYWEVSIEFTEKMTLYKRTWQVDILPAEETILMA